MTSLPPLSDPSPVPGNPPAPAARTAAGSAASTRAGTVPTASTRAGATRAVWRELQRQVRRLAGISLRTLLEDPGRPAQMTFEAAGLVADFSKQRIDAGVLTALHGLARAAQLDAARRQLFGGAIVNPTEGRPALHTALRGVGGDARVAAEVAAERDRIRELAGRFRSGALPGFDGRPLASLVCIGIGGSDLGPRLVCDALAPADAPDVRFVANVDPSDLQRALIGLDPRTTGFVVVSKTFTTRETLANADAARRWLQAAGASEADALRHLIGVTANPDAAQRYGIAADRVLRFWDWVGGRYSLWSAVGVSIAAACGPERFDALLDGAAAMDRHFRDAPIAANLPALLGLISIWNRDALGCTSQAVIPYAERLRLLPSYLQQLIMESNGKTARLDGKPTEHATAPVIWGVSGTNGQHSFFQQLHQGPDVVPVDFIVAREPEAPAAASDPRHAILVANCLAQSAALALGRPLPGAGEDWHKAFPGNRPSTMLLLPRVDAAALGALLAAYEHATFTASIVLGINAFDQFGVEYGKVMATSIEAVLAGGDGDALDPATRALIVRLRRGA
ncbi:MAG: glucose-6-phosphate isomerase [Lautropia sp.]